MRYDCCGLTEISYLRYCNRKPHVAFSKWFGSRGTNALKPRRWREYSKCPVSVCHGLKTCITRDSTEKPHSCIFERRVEIWGVQDRMTDGTFELDMTDEPRGPLRNAPFCSPCKSATDKTIIIIFLPSKVSIVTN